MVLTCENESSTACAVNPRPPTLSIWDRFGVLAIQYIYNCKYTYECLMKMGLNSPTLTPWQFLKRKRSRA